MLAYAHPPTLFAAELAAAMLITEGLPTALAVLLLSALKNLERGLRWMAPENGVLRRLMLSS